MRDAEPGRTPRWLAGIVAVLALATGIGLIALWPSDAPEPPIAEGLAGETERAEIVATRIAPCPAGQPGNCVTVEAELETGPDRDRTVEVPVGEETIAPEIEVGDQLRLARGATVPGEATAPTYSLVDFERRSPMLWLALIFAALVIAFGRLRGALSLLGLLASLAVVIAFVLPAILDGKSPLGVAVVGSLAVMLLTISLAHGLGRKSLVAMLGTAISLGLVAALASAFTGVANLTGLASEEAVLLQVEGAGIAFDGLLVAGMVIAALGVLDDVTVSQASTVLALRETDPSMPRPALFRRALAVGRDHVSATVNTLVLAYVGASLPVLLIFSSGTVGLLDAVNAELVAKEVVGMLVGSIGLIAAVPVTTWIAAALAPPAQQGRARQPGRPRPEDRVERG